MSFILIPKNGEDIKINAWNWRPTILLLYHANLIDKQQHELMACNGCGTKVSSEAAKRIAEFLDRELAKMSPGQRLRGDLVITSEAKKRAVFTPSSKMEYFHAVEIYSATYEWLATFRDFCRTCEGFMVS